MGFIHYEIALCVMDTVKHFKLLRSINYSSPKCYSNSFVCLQVAF